MSLPPRNPKDRTPLPPPLPPSGVVLGEARERLRASADQELWMRCVLAAASAPGPRSVQARAVEAYRAVKAGPPSEGGAA